MIHIRKEQKKDFKAIREVNDKAFEQPEEGIVVEKIRNRNSNILSLVAEVEGKVIGHILFSPAVIEMKDKTWDGMGLAPMSVLPEYQNKGIGTKLVDAGMKEIRNRDCPFVIVLGHPNYYPRFGFKTATRYGVKCQWEVPEEAFMIMILDENAMDDITGVAKYLPEFNDAM